MRVADFLFAERHVAIDASPIWNRNTAFHIE